MDNGALVTESIHYAKDTFLGKWTRWLIFIICGLPFALLPFVFDTKKMADATAFSWEMIPWAQLAAVCITGLLLSFILSGYLAHVYRGVTPPPEFDNWGPLYIDGIRIAVTGFLWFIPMFLVIAAMLVTVIAGFSSGSTMPGGLTVALFILLLIIEIIVAIIAVIYSMMGVVRCARTGSIREGIRFSAITETLRTIGWANYIVALIVILVIGIVFFVVLGILSLIPYAGWIIQLIVTPFYTIFSARYIARVYDHGVPQPVAAPAATI